MHGYGTSVATPVAAGGAIIVRQYFTDGFYPTGFPVVGNVYLPSAPLLKAVILGAAAYYHFALSSTLKPSYLGQSHVLFTRPKADL